MPLKANSNNNVTNCIYDALLLGNVQVSQLSETHELITYFQVKHRKCLLGPNYYVRK